MTKQEAIAAIGQEVYWLPKPIPEMVSPETEIPKGVLTEVVEKVTANGTQVLVTAGFETHKVDGIYPNFDTAKAGLKERYIVLRDRAAIQVGRYTKLVTDCDQIGVFPEPEPGIEVE